VPDIIKSVFESLNSGTKTVTEKPKRRANEARRQKQESMEQMIRRVMKEEMAKDNDDDLYEEDSEEDDDLYEEDSEEDELYEEDSEDNEDSEDDDLYEEESEDDECNEEESEDDECNEEESEDDEEEPKSEKRRPKSRGVIKPTIGKYNEDTIRYLGSMLRKASAPKAIMKAYEGKLYNRCTSWLSKEKGIKLNLREGFTKKESTAIRKYLESVKAPKMVLKAFENGQHSIVESYLRARK